MAVAIARAKIVDVDVDDVLHRVTDLASGFDGGDLHDVDEDVRVFFHPRTLAQLTYLRRELDDSRGEDVFLRGALLGIMHGKHRKNGGTSFLSIDMPNTFSMSPEYVRGFVKLHGLKQPAVDVFGQLRNRSSWLLRGDRIVGPPQDVLLGDATNLPEVLAPLGVRTVGAIVTSPPYLGILRYGAFNWLRLWLLGHSPADVDRMLDGTDSLDKYLSFFSSFLTSAGRVLRVGGRVALVVGDVVENGQCVALAERVWHELGDLVPFRAVSIEADRYDTASKSTRIWGEGRKGSATPLDRILVLERVAKRSNR
jgi:site-specific DNA-methyltransferase (adenine-specific)